MDHISTQLLGFSCYRLAVTGYRRRRHCGTNDKRMDCIMGCSMKLFFTRTSWTVLDGLAAFITVSLLIVILLKDSIGEIEGHNFPAATPMTLIGAYEKDGSTVFEGQSERLRPGCSPVRLEWWIGHRGGQTAPVAVKWGPAKVQPNSTFFFNGWTAAVTPPSVFVNDTFGDVLHKCKLFYSVDEKGRVTGGVAMPWLTRSAFWN